jgi:hypothetical protein
MYQFFSCLSDILPNLVSSKPRVLENICKDKGVPLVEEDLEGLLVSRMRAWIRVQANLFPHYFVVRKELGYQEQCNLKNKGFWQQW